MFNSTRDVMQLPTVFQSSNLLGTAQSYTALQEIQTVLLEAMCSLGCFYLISYLIAFSAKAENKDGPRGSFHREAASNKVSITVYVSSGWAAELYPLPSHKQNLFLLSLTHSDLSRGV